MNLGVQYYRPPFPSRKHWVSDFRRIRDSGLNTVQLWVIWAWVEAKPGEFNFDDYDRLVELAEANGLGIVLSTIAEVQPHWIHKAAPGSEMITSMGQKVISSNRCECHFGITPGGCTDHPIVWERMAGFLETTVKRYRSARALRGWDAWNELRWNVQADGLVCFCPHTLQAFRNWLDKKYGGLTGLNKTWLRRYSDWDEVMPGKAPDRPYTEMMAWEHFITWRSNQHGKARTELMKALDPRRPVTVHSGTPSAISSGDPNHYPLERGNDWAFADEMDGVGCSSFPKWSALDDVDFGIRIECVKSAARDKLVWLSEVQGGRAGVNFKTHLPVDAISQQRWIWNGKACGADTILFWCWRDEVFGRESAGFGLIGRDGLAEERLAAMRITGKIMRKHHALLNAYRPAQPEVGVLFSPQAYYLAWAAEGLADRIRAGLWGYARSLTRSSIPYQMVEEEHLDALKGIHALFAPRCIVAAPETEAKIEAFVRNGGTLICESEFAAFTQQGIYREPNERFLARLTGAKEIGRRNLMEDGRLEMRLNKSAFNLPADQWLTPMTKTRKHGVIWARNKEGILAQECPVGKGRVIMIGAYLGNSYMDTREPDFERFLETVTRQAGCRPAIEVVEPQPAQEKFLYIKAGKSGRRNMLFVFYPEGITETRLRIKQGFFHNNSATDIITGKRVKATKENNRLFYPLQASPLGMNALVET